MSPEEYVKQFDPLRDPMGFVEEPPEEYVKRISSLLPQWPDEVLIEWLHRHNTAATRYVFGV